MPVHINYMNKVANGLNFIHLQEDAMQMHQLYQLFISKYSTVRTKDSSHPERAMAAPLNQGYYGCVGFLPTPYLLVWLENKLG